MALPGSHTRGIREAAVTWIIPATTKMPRVQCKTFPGCWREMEVNRDFSTLAESTRLAVTGCRGCMRDQQGKHEKEGHGDVRYREREERLQYSVKTRKLCA